MIEIRSSRLRRLIRIAVPVILLPLTLALGIWAFGGKKYAFLSLAVAVWAFILFVAGFERKKTGTRRLVLVCCMTALSVAGRFIPVFKPVTAFTVLCGIYLGGEAGFLTGALSAVVSNFYFGQGPWTPFQMCAWGLIGLIAGLLGKWLSKSRALTVLYGVVSGLLYSMVMDVWTVVWYNGGLDLRLYGAAVVTALPFTALYCASNALFLFFFARPFGEKMVRVKRLYGV